MATIYFSGSISGGREDVGMYQHFVAALERAGHRVLAGMVTAAHVGADGETLSAQEIFDRDMQWIGEAQILVAEVSRPSIGVGYEIAAARYHFGIPVVSLYRPAFTRRCSGMIAGDRGIHLVEYTDATLDEAVAKLLEIVNKGGPPAV